MSVTIFKKSLSRPPFPRLIYSWKLRNSLNSCRGHKILPHRKVCNLSILICRLLGLGLLCPTSCSSSISTRMSFLHNDLRRSLTVLIAGHGEIVSAWSHTIAVTPSRDPRIYSCALRRAHHSYSLGSLCVQLRLSVGKGLNSHTSRLFLLCQLTPILCMLLRLDLPHEQVLLANLLLSQCVYASNVVLFLVLHRLRLLSLLDLVS